MSITTACPNCGKQFVVSESFIGKTAKCKSCGKPFAIAAPGGDVGATARGPSARAAAGGEANPLADLLNSTPSTAADAPPPPRAGYRAPKPGAGANAYEIDEPEPLPPPRITSPRPVAPPPPRKSSAASKIIAVVVGLVVVGVVLAAIGGIGYGLYVLNKNRIAAVPDNPALPGVTIEANLGNTPGQNSTLIALNKSLKTHLINAGVGFRDNQPVHITVTLASVGNEMMVFSPEPGSGSSVQTKTVFIDKVQGTLRIVVGGNTVWTRQITQEVPHEVHNTTPEKVNQAQWDAAAAAVGNVELPSNLADLAAGKTTSVMGDPNGPPPGGVNPAGPAQAHSGWPRTGTPPAGLPPGAPAVPGAPAAPNAPGVPGMPGATGAPGAPGAGTPAPAGAAIHTWQSDLNDRGVYLTFFPPPNFDADTARARIAEVATRHLGDGSAPAGKQIRFTIIMQTSASKFVRVTAPTGGTTTHPVSPLRVMVRQAFVSGPGKEKAIDAPALGATATEAEYNAAIQKQLDAAIAAVDELLPASITDAKP